MKSVKILLVCLVAILVFSTLAYAEVPKMINYQGKITTPQGALISDTFSIVFSIYADSTGGTALWTETQSSVKVEYGVFSVLLGSVNSIPSTVFDGNSRYLGLKVGNDNEMTPRKAIVSVGYAYKSFESDTAEYARRFSGIVENADKVDEYHYSANWPTTIGNVQIACSNDFHNLGGIDDDVPDNDGEVPDNISINNGRLYAPSGTGNVGIGSTSPAFKLDVSGSVNASSGYLVDGSAVIDDVARYFYTRNTSTNKFGAMPNGFGIDALNSGDWDFLVYEDNIYLQYSNPDAIVYVGGTIQDYNDGTVNIGEALDVDGAFSANTVNTGQGNYELYAMDQNVRTTDNPTFNRVNLSDYGTAAGGFHVGGTSDPGTDNLIVDGNVGIGTTSPAYKLDVSGVIGTSDGTLTLRSGVGGLTLDAQNNTITAERINPAVDATYYLGGSGVRWGNVYTVDFDVSGDDVRFHNLPVESFYAISVSAEPNSRVYRASSSKRYKENIQQLRIEPDKIFQLEPVKFNWKSTGNKDIGLIAEDVAQAIPDLVMYDKEGNPDAVKYDRVAIYLLEIVKEQQKEIETLKAKLEKLESNR